MSKNSSSKNSVNYFADENSENVFILSKNLIEFLSTTPGQDKDLNVNADGESIDKIIGRWLKDGRRLRKFDGKVHCANVTLV